MRASLILLLLLGAVSVPTGGMSNERAAFATKAEIANGLQTLTFTTPEGEITLHLPDELLPGDTISGTISVIPAGASTEIRTAHAPVLGSYSVACGTQVRLVSSPIATWTLPATVPPEGFAFVLQSNRDQEVIRVRVPALSKPVQINRTFHLPETGQTGRLIAVSGPFDGDLSTTELKSDAETIQLVAESPRKLVARNSYAKRGMALLALRERDRLVETDFRSVDVSLAAPTTTLPKGEMTTLTIRIFGLEGLSKPLAFVLENASSDVITLSNGNLEKFRIAPAETADGIVTLNRSITGIKRGSWTISCSLVKDE